MICHESFAEERQTTLRLSPSDRGASAGGGSPFPASHINTTIIRTTSEQEPRSWRRKAGPSFVKETLPEHLLL